MDDSGWVEAPQTLSYLLILVSLFALLYVLIVGLTALRKRCKRENEDAVMAKWFHDMQFRSPEDQAKLYELWKKESDGEDE